MEVGIHTRILIVGVGRYEIYEKAIFNGFRELGYQEVELFTWSKDYQISDRETIRNTLKKIEERTTIQGIYNSRINKRLIKKCKVFSPELVFFYNCRLFTARTVEKIKKGGAVIISYSNDNPFSRQYPRYFWKKFFGVSLISDIVYAYRNENIEEYRHLGIKNVALLRSYYIAGKNYLIEKKEKIRDVPDVVFLGHVENDERIECINTLLKSGVKVGVQAGTSKYYYQCDNLYDLSNSHTEYNEIICSAKIALVFLSKRNNDTYTRRCFEIPITGTLMMSIYTKDLETLYEDKKEAVFFQNAQELLELVNYYLERDDERLQIGTAGRKRVLMDGHEVKDRVKQIVMDCKAIDMKGNPKL